MAADLTGVLQETGLVHQEAALSRFAGREMSAS